MTAHLDDDAVSAACDGAATPAELEHLEGCSACRQRLQRMVAVAGAIGTPVQPASGATVDAAITRALLAAEGAPGQSTGMEPERRVGRPGGGRRLRLGLVAAAVLVVVGGSLAALRGMSTHSSTSKATAAAGSSTTIEGSLGPMSSGRELGSYSDSTALAVDLRGLLASNGRASSDGSAPSTQMGTLSPCEGAAVQAAGVKSGTAPTLVGGLSWKGQLATVLVFSPPEAGGSPVGVVLALPGCQVLSLVSL